MHLIECNGLTKTYGKTAALQDVNLEIPAGGGIVGLLGPNGSGKTTFIKCIRFLYKSKSCIESVISIIFSLVVFILLTPSTHRTCSFGGII